MRRSDYSGVPASVNSTAATRRRPFSFSATADDVDDDGESVKLGFGTLPGGVSAGGTSETTVAIADDDVPSVSVNFGQAAYRSDEGASVAVTVTLSADPERPVMIPLTTTEQDGATSADYAGVPASLTFEAGRSPRTSPSPRRPTRWTTTGRASGWASTRYPRGCRPESGMRPR